MILLIDNYDSFSYNLFQFVGTINPDIKVIRNDGLTVSEIEKLAPSHILISPGPGKPADAGVCENVIQYFKGKIPILGVCLGHQAICETFGAEVTYAPKLMHGKQSEVKLDEDCSTEEPIAEIAMESGFESVSYFNRRFRKQYQMTPGHFRRQES